MAEAKARDARRKERQGRLWQRKLERLGPALVKLLESGDKIAKGGRWKKEGDVWRLWWGMGVREDGTFVRRVHQWKVRVASVGVR